MIDQSEHFDLDKMYEPLFLVDYKKPDKISREVSPEQGSRFSEPSYSQSPRFNLEQVLQDILRDSKGKSSKIRVAIVGEPGAGKSTLLQKTAFWVHENTENLPILISLADLPKAKPEQETLEQYLLSKWLKAALPYISSNTVEITEALKTELKQHCNQGHVWLLIRWGG